MRLEAEGAPQERRVCRKFFPRQAQVGVKSVAVVGPPGAGKTLVATSLALYLHLATAGVAYVDKSVTKAGAGLVKSHLPLAADVEEVAELGVDYVVIDAAPYDVPPADVYIFVLEPTDLRYFTGEGVYVVVNKTSRWSLRGIPFDSRISWAMQAGVPPVVADIKGFERTRKRIVKVVKEIGDGL
ncbi:MAG: hypothetical protein ACPL3C_08245 [Pyrobaculum sp.]